MHNIPFRINVTSTAFAALLVFFFSPGFSPDHRLFTKYFAEMLPLLVLLSLSTTSNTLHLTEVADIAIAVQQYFYTRGTVLLTTQERCKCSTIDSASKSDVFEFMINM